MQLCEINDKDVPGLIEMARQMYEESPNYRDCQFEPLVVRNWFYNSIENPQSFFCRKVVKDGKIIATMLGFIVNMVLSSTKSAGDVGLYVLPEHRGSKAALLLILAYENWLQKQDCKRAILGITAGINDDEVARFYKKLGYRHFGETFIKEFK